MCLIAFALQAHARYPLVLAANRDEFHARPTRSAHWWEPGNGSRVYGGRDIEAGGSWLLLGPAGRLVALTNYREPNGASAPRSRGALVAELAASASPLPDAMTALGPGFDDFAGFSLLAFDWSAPAGTNAPVTPRAWLLTNRGPHGGSGPVPISPGAHTLSNGPLDAPWPKSVRLQETMQDWCGQNRRDVAPLLAALGHSVSPDPEHLPDTGVGSAMERLLGSAFIRSEPSRGYGTRSSAIISLETTGLLSFDEWTWDAQSLAPQWTQRRNLQAKVPGP